jgi:hypothetical protein
MVIGIAGYARSGKDTLCHALVQALEEVGKTGRQYTLAAELKQDLSGLIWEVFQKDIWTLSGSDKELVRPLMVAYGSIWRKTSQGTHYPSILDPQLDEAEQRGFIPIISDIRYAEYERDELQWIKDARKGKLIYVERHMNIAPNEDELRNCAKLRECADLVVSWDTFSVDGENVNARALPYARDAIRHLGIA